MKVTTSNTDPADFRDGTLTLAVSDGSGETATRRITEAVLEDAQLLAFMTRQLAEELTGGEFIPRVGR